MKTSFFNKTLLCFFATGSLFLASCIDKSVDLDNLSEDMALGGKITLPVLKESRINIYELLERYQSDNVSEIKVDTTGGDIFLIYDTVFKYGLNQINFDFSAFAGNMNEDVGIFDLTEGTSIGDILPNLEFFGVDEIAIPVGTNSDYSIPLEFNLNDQLSGENQKLSKVEFLNTNIVIKIEPNFRIETEGLLTLKITLPDSKPGDAPWEIQVKPGITEYKKETNSFIVPANSEFGFEFILTGDGRTNVKPTSNIACGIALESRDEIPAYVAYGWFNYTYRESIETDDNKKDTVAINLSDYIPGAGETVLKMLDPQFTFEIRSTLGIPLEFGLDTIQGEFPERIEIFKNTKDAFPIGSVPLDHVGDTIHSDPVLINNDFFAGSSYTFSDFINTDLQSLGFFYHFGTDEVDLENTDNVPVQFVTSDSYLEVSGKLRVPLAFDEGSVICYRDTMELDLDTESLEDVSSLELHFTYTNHLPIGFYVELSLLDESHQNILGQDKVYQTITIGKAIVDAEGAVDENQVASDKYILKFDKDQETSIIQMKDAKYISFSYRSIEKGDSSEPRIRLKATDYLSLQLGIFIDGQILVN
jgi:hypothetical protein